MVAGRPFLLLQLSNGRARAAAVGKPAGFGRNCRRCYVGREVNRSRNKPLRRRSGSRARAGGNSPHRGASNAGEADGPQRGARGEGGASKAPAVTSSTDRVRRHRDRVAVGRIAVTVEVDEVEAIEVLAA